ncbi:MAG TPA: helical backbone metal receptor [Rubricoccaceae bacterium]|jgi:ABC-type Fe3+-hydroxamate transport system substrate-binding protein
MPASVLLGPPPPPAPRRIVSLVPSLTEALAALGLDDQTVGLTRFCVHPDGWKARKTIVGGTKGTDPARVLALRPDLVVANREENDRAPVEALAAAGVPFWLCDIATVADTIDALRSLGHVTGCPDAGDRLAAAIVAAFDTLPVRRTPLRVVYLIWRDPWMTVGSDTIIHDVMARGGLVNAFGDRTRYPAVTGDEIADARPDAILLSSEPYPFSDQHVAEVQALAPGARVTLVDGEAFSWYGPRLARAPAEIARVLQKIGA